MSRKVRIALFLVACLVLSPFQWAAQQEKQIKAAWLEKFARFVDWPEGSGMNDASTPFILGVVGKNSFGSILENVYRKNKIKRKNVEFRFFPSFDKDKEGIAACHLLFVSSSLKKKLPEVLLITKGKPVLIVGDTKGFAEKGVHINFYTPGKRLHFEINPIAVKEASLSIDPSFLDIAKIVKPKGNSR
ncbi:MAG: YfiR family protein [bacterium]|nr:YfiR family protein [bacterium]